MKNFFLLFGAFMAFNVMINAQTPRPDRSGGPAAAPQGTETKSTDVSGKSTDAKPAATTTTTKTSSSTDATTQGTDTKSADGTRKSAGAKPNASSSTPKRSTPATKPTSVDTKRRPTTQGAAPVKEPNPAK